MFKLSKIVVGLLFVTQSVSAAIEVREPEAATGLEQKQVVSGTDYMVAAANPYAVAAGNDILRRGGSAVDAAIAVQLVLTLVEPQSSGIGGGLFLLHYNNKDKKLITIDGRETAPKKAHENLFINAQTGKADPWIKAVVGGRSVGVPGALAALKMAHSEHGKLPWSSLFERAVSLSRNGFIVSPRLEKLLSMRINPGLTKLPSINRYFYPNGEPLKAGTVKKNPELANLLSDIAKNGIDAFYKGNNAKEIVDAVSGSIVAPGLLSLDDLASYQAKVREPICTDYRKHNVCSMAPPSSGGIAVLQILKLIERFNMNKLGVNSIDALHIISQASRLAFADRNFYITDPDFHDVPTKELLNPSYLSARSALITNKDMGKALPGDLESYRVANDDSYELPSTSHISIVDKEGNAVSLTSSIEMAFGSTVMVNGYILNNQLTDFALSATKNGAEVMNRVEPNKRPRSSMAPVMVFNENGTLSHVVGSPGGSRIINYVTKTLVAMLDWQLTPQHAIELANMTNRNDITTLEKGTELETLKGQLEKRGHQVAIKDLNSGIHAISVENEKLLGGADPRREGIVMSDLSNTNAGK